MLEIYIAKYTRRSFIQPLQSNNERYRVNLELIHLN